MLNLIANTIINVIGGALGLLVIVSILAVIIGLPIMFRKEEEEYDENNI